EFASFHLIILTMMQTEELSILLVEDEKKIADVLKKGLTEQQFHVEVAYDGLIGKKLFETYPFNLIILDLNLPGINGYELCKIIRSRNKITGHWHYRDH